ncbi:MAG: 4Fe-4S binding protein [Phycisphaerae bacterium]
MRLNLFIPWSNGRAKRLRRYAPSWLFSPVRRIVQVACLGLLVGLLFHVCQPCGPTGHTPSMRAHDIIPVETFLALDPLVSISVALAARTWIWSLPWAGAIVLACVLFPRGFCGYVCPLGTLIDAFDWILGRRCSRLHIRRPNGWAAARYGVLTAVVVASLFGVLLGGFLAAIPVLTHGLAFAFGPLESGLVRGWDSVPPLNYGHWASLALLAAVVGLGVFGRRFWCRYACPTGAFFSVTSTLRVAQREVTTACIRCGQCVKACPFDAINPDFSTRTDRCTFCQTCGGACPVRAIQFVGRWNKQAQFPADKAVDEKGVISRRAFLAGGAGSAAGLVAALAIPRCLGANLAGMSSRTPLRPPGSLPEEQFLRTCIRCGMCVKACPTGLLQPIGFGQGLWGLWTPRAMANWAACDPKCNNCGQVCPTGAIRPLPLEDKRLFRMGLAVVDKGACLAHTGRQECGLCYLACEAAGYQAIDMVEREARPAGGTGGEEEGRKGGGEPESKNTGEAPPVLLAPVVLAHKCVGCGACQAACFSNNVRRMKLLGRAAIWAAAGRA